jgi:crossover junction endodeoxyribonuclease RusA
MSAAREWRLGLAYAHIPLSANDRLHWAERSRRSRKLRDKIRWLTRHHNIPRLDRIHVQIEWTPAVARTRDPENLAPTQKAIIDGLRDYGSLRDQPPWVGIVADDGPDHVTWSPPVIHAPDRTATQRLVVVITELSGE